MADLPEITAIHKTEYGFNKLWLETDDDTGHLCAELEQQSGEFRIEVFSVSTLGRGLGEELLRRAKAEALAMNARRISAAIRSAECLASMTEVFGAENVFVQRPGEVGQPGTTRAKLEFYIVEPYL